MEIIKFLVKVNRGGIRPTEYVQHLDRAPIRMTTNRKRALLMGRFTAEDAIKSIENSRCIPELVSVITGRSSVGMSGSAAGNNLPTIAGPKFSS
jgi:hypothetical protein